MIIRFLERAPLSQEAWHKIRNNLLVVCGRIKSLHKDGIVTTEEYALCAERLREVEEVLVGSFKKQI